MKTGTLGGVIEDHFRRYPDMGIQDLYKLVYQGVMGSGHAISSPDSARARLMDETAGALRPLPGETLVEEVSPGGLVVRINLRPFIAGGGNTESLLRAFIRTGNEFTGSTESLVEHWMAAAGLQQRFTSKKMLEFIGARRRKGFPAVHHSSEYREKYRPSYRVALRSICLEEGVPG